MVFDDVSLPAVVFVTVIMVVALVGNSLVLLVFGCRWRSTNDTKIYIMTLAALDLVCVLVSCPRDLLTLQQEAERLVRKDSMRVFCKLSVFFTHLLNVTSALILVAIATSRFAKVTRKETRGTKERKPGPWQGFKSALKRGVRGFSSVRGAKISSVVAFCLAVVQVFPALIIYGSGGSDDLFHANVSHGPSSGGSHQDGHYGRFSCRDDVQGDYRATQKIFDMSQFVLFVILTVTLLGIYSATLKKVCCQSPGHSDPSRRDSLFFCPDQHEASLVLLQKLGSGEHSVEKQTTWSATSAENSVHEAESVLPASPSSVSQLVVKNSTTTSAAEERSVPTPASDSGPARSPDSGPHHLTFRPSPPRSPEEQWSDVPLSRQTSHNREDRAPFNRLSTASFQLTKTGNRARLTTLVFLLVTFIYIVSYFPYFVYVMYEYLAESGGEKPWRQWDRSSQAVMMICGRSYLIANAANPLVYGLCNPYFREQLGKLLICRRDVI